MAYVVVHDGNRATPNPTIINQTPDLTLYFTMNENDLAGNYAVFGDVTPMYFNDVSDESGNVYDRFTIYLDEPTVIHGFSITGNAVDVVYPVDFQVQYFLGDERVYYYNVTGNAEATYTHDETTAYTIDHVFVVIRKISRANTVGQILSVSFPNNIHTTDRLIMGAEVYQPTYIYCNDDLTLVNTVASGEQLHEPKCRDSLVLKSETNAVLSNVHTVLQRPDRQVLGKVAVNYAGQFSQDAITATSSGYAKGCPPENAVTGFGVAVKANEFTMYHNDLSGTYEVMDDGVNRGWISDIVSDATGAFDPAPWIELSFNSRMLAPCTITTNCTITSGTLIVYHAGKTTQYTLDGSQGTTIEITSSFVNATGIYLEIDSINVPNAPIQVNSIPLLSTFWYYGESNDLFSMDILEELSFSDEVESAGGMSANSVEIRFNNVDKNFFYNGSAAAFSQQLKQNRRIIPYLGTEINGQVEWTQMGVFWSYNWEVQPENLYASVLAYDSLWLLTQIKYIDYQIGINQTVYALLTAIFEDAKLYYPFLTWNIDSSLQNYTIPYSWFNYDTHFAAISRLTSHLRYNVYCDRFGTIQVMPYKTLGVTPMTTLKDSSSMLPGKTYPSLYTTLPNTIEVSVTNVVVHNADNVINVTTPFEVSAGEVQDYVSSSPVYGTQTVTIDTSIPYTAVSYGWGTRVTYATAGTVNSVIITAQFLETTTPSTVRAVDASRAASDGTCILSISSDFIQSGTLAKQIAQEVLDNAATDAYDLEAPYRGDIALVPGDTVTYLDGIAPSTEYIVKRNELMWDGALTGTIRLNA